MSFIGTREIPIPFLLASAVQKAYWDGFSPMQCSVRVRRGIGNTGIIGTVEENGTL